MSRSSRHKEKHGSRRSELSQDYGNEGTAARTRPFSFDEIMLRRKNKKQSEDVESARGEAGNISVKSTVEKVFDRSESGRGYANNNDSLSVVVKHSSEDFGKSSRKKEDKITTSEEKSVKRKDKASRDSESKSKPMLNKGVGDKAKEVKDDRRGHGRRKNDEWSSGDSENESGKRRARDLVGKERYRDRTSGKSEKETKRKHTNKDDERSREKHAVKRHDSGKWHDADISERKERKELSEYRNEESRSKKRRSRSRERDKDKGRRSPSLSPRSHKRSSYNVREHGELVSHSDRDRSRKQQSDDDRNRISSEGRRHGASTSGLGGYSPRKRRSEAGAKTPSPPHRSPEKKSAGWDLPPAAADVNATGSVLSNMQSSNQTASSNTYELPNVAPVSSTTMKALSMVFSNAAIDSVQLTQATRPMRRLYVENLPASASEKAVMEWLNSFLLSSGVNHIHGSLPCISCIIHKEKGQALVEFLTPEDASAALSFNGRFFSGSILKIRRPKDYVEMAGCHDLWEPTDRSSSKTGVPDKSLAAFDSLSDIVRDSPHKIFIGGIPKAISSEMLREITSAFGPLKAFHFEINTDLNEPCAFLEYVDHSITLKACTGLNGMRLGGQMLTVVLATPDSSSAENIGNSPFYGIPEHAKPLLEKPTQVLKLKNVLDPEVVSSISEPELEEILEDIRLECSRFGTVKSLNFVNCGDFHTILETEIPGSASNDQDMNCNEYMKVEIPGEHTVCDSHEISRSESPNNGQESEDVVKSIEGVGIGGDIIIIPTADLIDDEMSEPAPLGSQMALQDSKCDDNSSVFPVEPDDQLNSKDQMECHDGDKVDDNILTRDAEMENESKTQEKLKLEEANGKLQEELAEVDCSLTMDSDALEKSENKELVFNLEDVFEPGCVLVEYRRTEASSVAAHCLHGRLFDNRMVTVGYVAYDIYRARFPK